VAHPQIAAFAGSADGGVKPLRSIAGQNTLFTRTIHDMAYDGVRDEILVPSFYAFGILTFKGDATGDVAPIRKIFGPHTGLKLPERLAVDAVHGEIFVPQGDSVLVFPRDADGDVAPIRILKGPDTQLGAASLTVDPVHNLLIAVNGGSKSRILVFNRTDSGNTKPLRAITDLSGAFLGGVEQMTTYPPRGYILVTVRLGRGGAQQTSEDQYVGVWSIYDNGNVPPLWTIGGPHGMLRDIRGVAVDPKRKNVFISDKYVNGILTYHFPEIF